jgi:methyl-accepting chemotaxis protein
MSQSCYSLIAYIDIALIHNFGGILMMSPDSGRSRASFGAQFSSALTFSVLLPVLALLGLAGGVWYLEKVQISTLTTTQEIFFGGVIGAAVLVGLISSLLWNRTRARIRNELTQIAEACRASIGGATSVRVPVNGSDEFTKLAGSVNMLLENRDGGLSTQDALALQNQIEKLLAEVSAVGEGDLRVQAEVTPDTLGVLADSFNYMIEELAKVVGRVQSTTQQVIGATRRILERTSELTRGAEAQFAQTAIASEQVEDLAAFILRAARNATLSASAAQDALNSSREGQGAVVKTIEGMQHIRDNVQETSKKIKRLGERSQEITDIVRIIEELAEQTNLLALNAAIQSAMAGENGRGFAVVADEIRLLAERSGEAAKRIVTLVKGIQNETQEAVVAMEESTVEVVNGSNMADDAGRALQAINVAVENQVRMIEDIAASASERSQTSELVAEAMNRIADLTRQTNATMQDTAANVSYLAELADQLRASVSTFRLPPQQQQQLPPPQVGRGGPPPMMDPRGGSGFYPAPFPSNGLPALPPGMGTGQMGGMRTGQMGGTGNFPSQNGGMSPTQRPMGPQQGGPPPPYRGGPPPNGQPQPMPPGQNQNNYPGQNPNGYPGPGQSATFDPWSDSQDGFEDGDQRPAMPPFGR